MKEYRIYTKQKGRRESSQGWDTKEDAVRFMAETLYAGHAINDIELRGKNIPARLTLSLLADAERLGKHM